MDEQLRQAIGKALYECFADFTDSRIPRWESLFNKGEWIHKAEKVVEVYKVWLIEHAPPVLRAGIDEREDV
jgi:hypothetical protein